MSAVREIINKFLETQNISTILTEITALFIAWQGWVKYRDTHKRKFLKALNGTQKVDELLIELQDAFEDRHIIPCVAQITNGGGVPRPDKPLYISALNSTNNEVLSLWGQKTLVVSNLSKAITRLINNGYSYLDIDKFELTKVRFWAGAKAIDRVYYFPIGFTKKSFKVLAVNVEGNEVLTDLEMMICTTYAAKIKQSMNTGKKFYESKIE